MGQTTYAWDVVYVGYRAYVRTFMLDYTSCLRNLGPVCFFFFFFSNHSSLLTQFSSFITHHLKYPNFPNPTRLDIVFCSHHSKFSTFCGPIPVIWGSFYNFFFPLQPPIPKLIERSEKKKTHTHTPKNPNSPNLVKEEEEKEKEKEKKKKKKIT